MESIIMVLFFWRGHELLKVSRTNEINQNVHTCDRVCSHIWPLVTYQTCPFFLFLITMWCYPTFTWYLMFTRSYWYAFNLLQWSKRPEVWTEPINVKAFTNLIRQHQREAGVYRIRRAFRRRCQRKYKLEKNGLIGDRWFPHGSSVWYTCGYYNCDYFKYFCGVNTLRCISM